MFNRCSEVFYKIKEPLKTGEHLQASGTLCCLYNFKNTLYLQEANVCLHINISGNLTPQLRVVEKPGLDVDLAKSLKIFFRDIKLVQHSIQQMKQSGKCISYILVNYPVVLLNG